METDTDEELETGYGPSAPPGDNLCNDYTQGLAAGYSSLARARGGRVEDVVDPALLLADTGSPSLFANIVVVREPLDDDGWRVAADRMHAFYGEEDGGNFLVFSAWPTPDLTRWDFGRIGHPPLMLRPPGFLEPSPGVDVEIRPVTDAAGAEDWERAFVSGFPEPALQPFQAGCLLPEPALAAEGWRHWVAYVEREPVGTASAHVSDRHVSVDCISTVDAARGRGIGRVLTATATSAEQGLTAMLIASDAGRPLYERLGYRSVLRFTLWAGHRQQ